MERIGRTKGVESGANSCTGQMCSAFSSTFNKSKRGGGEDKTCTRPYLSSIKAIPSLPLYVDIELNEVLFLSICQEYI